MKLHSVHLNKGIALLFLLLFLFVFPEKGAGQTSILLRHRENGNIVELKKGMSVKVKYYNSRGKRRVVMGNLSRITADSITVMPWYLKKKVVVMHSVRSIRYDNTNKVSWGWVLTLLALTVAGAVALLILVSASLSPAAIPMAFWNIGIISVFLLMIGVHQIHRRYKVDQPATKWEIKEPIPSSPPGSIPIP
jgi:hypothetical protein